MNIYIFIIIAILFEYLLSILINILNLKNLSHNLPEEFSDLFDNKKYLKSQRYTKENIKFSLFTSTFSTVLILVIIYFGLFNYIDLSIRNLGYNEITNGLLFIGSLLILNDMLFMPFSLYKNFVIEEKFGFNNMNLSIFFMDKIKGYFLMCVIGAPLIFLILYFFEIFDSNAWLYVWFIICIFSLAIQPVFNIFITPFFNKFTPLEEGSLLSEIKSYLLKVNFPVSKIDVMDGSKRSGHSNAYFSGIGKTKRIALYDTLLQNQSNEEILAVIAHEVGHYKCKHIQKNIIIGVIQSGITLYFMSFFLRNPDLFSVFKMENLSIYGSLIFFGILYAPIDIFTRFLFNYLSRKHEFEADKFSAKTTKKPMHLISSLKKLTLQNLSNLNPHWLNVWLNYTHPPVLQRINLLKTYIPTKDD